MTYTRLTPYVTGMYAAFVHLNDEDGKFLQSSSLLKEYVAFAILMVVTIYGASPQVNIEWNGFFHYIYYNTAR